MTLFDAPVTGVDRRVGFVFQQDAVFPWRDVLGNVMAGPLFRGVAQAKAEKEALDWMGFEARRALLDVLDAAVADPTAQVRVIAYDLSEREILLRLKKLGKRAGPGELAPVPGVCCEWACGKKCVHARACYLCRLLCVASRCNRGRACTNVPPLFARRRQGEPTRRRPRGGGAEEEGGAHKEGQAGARVGRRRRRARQG